MVYEDEGRNTNGAQMDNLRVENQFGLVKNIAESLASRLPGSVSFQELIDAGVGGLIDAADRYSPERGVPFPNFAFVRIRGAMLDMLREMDWVSRSVRKNLRRLDMARDRLEQKFGRPPREDELADYLEVALEEVREGQAQAVSSRPLSLDTLLSRRPGNGYEGNLHREVYEDVESRIEQEELVEILCEALWELPRKEYTVLALYYFEGLAFREVSTMIGVASDTVSQRHSVALDRLKKTIKRRYRLDELRYGI